MIAFVITGAIAEAFIIAGLFMYIENRNTHIEVLENMLASAEQEKEKQRKLKTLYANKYNALHAKGDSSI